nr:hypothetical protein [Myxococcota bacterium]
PSGLLARGAWTLVYGACAAGVILPVVAAVVSGALSGDLEREYVACGGPLPSSVPAGDASFLVDLDWEEPPPDAALDALALYVNAGARVCVPVPWRERDQTLDALRLARAGATLRSITIANQEPFASTDQELTDDEWTAANARAADAVAQVVERSRHDPALDPALAAMFAAQLATDGNDQPEPAPTELAAALGVAETCPDSAPRPQLAMSFDSVWMSSSTPEDDLAGLIGMVCEAGARGVWLTVPPTQ